MLVDPDAGANARHGRRWPAVEQSPLPGRQGVRAWLPAVWLEVPRQGSWTLLLYRFRGYCARLWRGKNRWFESFSKAPPVPVHRLAHGGNRLAKPQMWNERGRPCFAPGLASKIFLRGMQKYAPHPPLLPMNPPERARSGREGRVLEKCSERNKTEMRFVFATTGKGARGAGNFHFPSDFICGRDWGGCTRPLCALSWLGRFCLAYF